MRKILIGAALAALAFPAAAATQLADGGFETQAASVSSFCYFGTDCPSGPWTGSGAGLQAETNSAWPGTATPDGSKYGFVQSSGFLEQTFLSFDTGVFNLSWLEAGRPNSVFTGNLAYEVRLNGALLGNFSSTSFQSFTPETTANFNLAAGQSYTLRFQGLDTRADNTAFIDAVQLNYVSPIPSGAVPEPGAWALMILGFGGVGSLIRTRQRRLALA